MRIVMIGGTGFLGWFTTAELVARGHEVVAVGLEQPAPGSMPPQVRCVVMNLDTASDAEVSALLAGAGALIHAAGTDGRTVYDPPAIEGFRRANVEPMRRLLPLMKAARVPRLVIFGSYYTAIDRTFPQLRICQRNAYPRARREQAELARQLAGNELAVGVLELPYIFGAAPGRGTLWGFYMDNLRANAETVPVFGGGSACVTARQVAQAAAGACERLDGHRQFPLDEALRAVDGQKRDLAKAGKEAGYDPEDMIRWQTQPFFIDPLPAMEALGYGPDDLAAAIRDTVRATLEHGGQGPGRLAVAAQQANKS